MGLETFPFLENHTYLIPHASSVYKLKLEYQNITTEKKDLLSEHVSERAAHCQIEDVFRAVLYNIERDKELSPIQSQNFVIYPEKLSWPLARDVTFSVDEKPHRCFQHLILFKIVCKDIEREGEKDSDNAVTQAQKQSSESNGISPRKLNSFKQKNYNVDPQRADGRQKRDRVSTEEQNTSAITATNKNAPVLCTPRLTTDISNKSQSPKSKSKISKFLQRHINNTHSVANTDRSSKLHHSAKPKSDNINNQREEPVPRTIESGHVSSSNIANNNEREKSTRGNNSPGRQLRQREPPKNQSINNHERPCRESANAARRIIREITLAVENKESQSQEPLLTEVPDSHSDSSYSDEIEMQSEMYQMQSSNVAKSKRNIDHSVRGLFSSDDVGNRILSGANSSDSNSISIKNLSRREKRQIPGYVDHYRKIDNVCQPEQRLHLDHSNAITFSRKANEREALTNTNNDSNEDKDNDTMVPIRRQKISKIHADKRKHSPAKYMKSHVDKNTGSQKEIYNKGRKHNVKSSPRLSSVRKRKRLHAGRVRDDKAGTSHLSSQEKWKLRRRNKRQELGGKTLHAKKYSTVKDVDRNNIKSRKNSSVGQMEKSIGKQSGKSHVDEDRSSHVMRSKTSPWKQGQGLLFHHRRTHQHGSQQGAGLDISDKDVVEISNDGSMICVSKKNDNDSETASDTGTTHETELEVSSSSPSDKKRGRRQAKKRKRDNNHSESGVKSHQKDGARSRSQTSRSPGKRGFKKLGQEEQLGDGDEESPSRVTRASDLKDKSSLSSQHSTELSRKVNSHSRSSASKDDDNMPSKPRSHLGIQSTLVTSPVKQDRGQPSKADEEASTEESENVSPSGKRGRPRKLKSKDTSSEADNVSLSRKRGRPKELKGRDTDVSETDSVSSPRKRGRPRKLKGKDTSASESDNVSSPPRKRGRPMKLKGRDTDESETDSVSSSPRKRERPTKLKGRDTAASETDSVSSPRKRGRPTKLKGRDKDASETDSVSSSPRKRGRPTKLETKSSTRNKDSNTSDSGSVDSSVGSRGRRMKVKESELKANGDDEDGINEYRHSSNNRNFLSNRTALQKNVTIPSKTVQLSPRKKLTPPTHQMSLQPTHQSAHVIKATSVRSSKSASLPRQETSDISRKTRSRSAGSLASGKHSKRESRLHIPDSPSQQDRLHQAQKQLLAAKDGVWLFGTASDKVRRTKSDITAGQARSTSFQGEPTVASTNQRNTSPKQRQRGTSESSSPRSQRQRASAKQGANKSPSKLWTVMSSILRK